MRVVLAGFGPFPGARFNPSALLVKAIARRRRPVFAGIERIAHIFATTYASVDRDLPKLLTKKPDIVLIFGLAGRRRHVCIETRACNSVSVLFPDASGFRPQHGYIACGKPASLNGNAPFTWLLGAVRNRKIPARLSRDAGRYLCNYVYWQALDRARGRSLVQFVHLPPVRRARRRDRRHSSTQAQFLIAGEAILIALIAASRR
jgi:pyroglutamyl-peptidase